MEENVKTEKKEEKQPEVNQEKVKRPSLLKRVRRFFGGILSDLADLFKGLGQEIPEPFERQAKAQKRKHIGLFGLVRKIINTMFKIAGRMLKPLVRSYSDMNAAKQKELERKGKIVDGKQFNTGGPEPICPAIDKKHLLQEKQAYKDRMKGKGHFHDCSGDSRRPHSKQQRDERTANRRKI